MKVIITTGEIQALKSLSEQFAKESGKHEVFNQICSASLEEFASTQGFEKDGEAWIAKIDPDKYVRLIKLAESNVGAIVGLVRTLEGLWKTFKCLTDGIKAQAIAIMAK